MASQVQGCLGYRLFKDEDRGVESSYLTCLRSWVPFPTTAKAKIKIKQHHGSLNEKCSPSSQASKDLVPQLVLFGGGSGEVWPCLRKYVTGDEP